MKRSTRLARLPTVALRWLLVLAAAALAHGSTLAAQAAPVAQGSCRFVLGFATLRDLLGPRIVGDCLEDQRFAANGNAEQRTTGGLLVWRKADNWTAFTDGFRTWVNGPYGLLMRRNDERFWWEAAPDGPGGPQ